MSGVPDTARAPRGSKKSTKTHSRTIVKAATAKPSASHCLCSATRKATETCSFPEVSAPEEAIQLLHDSDLNERRRLKVWGSMILYFVFSKLVRDCLPYAFKTSENITRLRSILSSSWLCAQATRHICPDGIPGLDDMSSFKAIVGALRHLELARTQEPAVTEWIDVLFAPYLEALSAEVRAQLDAIRPPDLEVAKAPPHVISEDMLPLVPQDVTQSILEVIAALQLDGLDQSLPPPLIQAHPHPPGPPSFSPPRLLASVDSTPTSNSRIEDTRRGDLNRLTGRAPLLRRQNGANGPL